LEDTNNKEKKLITSSAATTNRHGREARKRGDGTVTGLRSDSNGGSVVTTEDRSGWCVGTVEDDV
jgi:hypothetical protein